jgi:hypothetical protein
MNADLLLPVITSLAWLIVAGSALASFRLGWSRIAKMALLWVAIFLGLFLISECFMTAHSAASPLI